MPIPTSEELKLIVKYAIASHLSFANMRQYFRLWPQKPVVFTTMFEQNFSLQPEDRSLFGKISIHRPSEDAEWGEASFLISTRNVQLNEFGIHILRLTLMQEILREFKQDYLKFQNS